MDFRLNLFILQFYCCGFRNITDQAVPPTCSVDFAMFSGNTPPTVPCYDKLHNALNSAFSSVGSIALSLGIIELVALLLSVFLFSRITSKDSQAQHMLAEAWRINRNRIQNGYNR